MKNRNSTDTKTKIMLTAFELFGRYGVEGTSIRKIAEQSGVNLAAINYHFKSKENLFWEIMYETFKEVDAEIKNFSEKSKDIYEMAELTFDYFLQEKMALKNTMKMMLMEGVGRPESEDVIQVLDNPMGPPGGIYFATKIQESVAYRLNQQGLMWGVKAIFGSIMHWSVMMSAESVCSDRVRDEMMAENQIRRDVMDMVRSSMEYLKLNQKKFSEA